MTSRITIIFWCSFLLITFTGGRWAWKDLRSSTTEIPNPVVAQLGNHLISLRDVEQRAAIQLVQADEQRTQILEQALHNLIDEHLLSVEARRLGVSSSQLLAQASQREEIARIANFPAPVRHIQGSQGSSPTGQREGTEGPNVGDTMRLRQALLVSLRRQAEIRVTLPKSERPQLAVSADDDPFLGSSDAAVTIIEFSDFQCPYCKQSVPILQELHRRYGDRLRIVYRDYPGPNHPQASLAAEAAQCAGDQGRFWDFHDALFARQSADAGWDFGAIARALNLRGDTFTSCLNSRRYREEVQKDLADAIRLGINSTPTFFINGRPLIGAHPVTDFTALIDPLLEESGL